MVALEMVVAKVVAMFLGELLLEELLEAWPLFVQQFLEFTLYIVGERRQ